MRVAADEGVDFLRKIVLLDVVDDLLQVPSAGSFGKGDRVRGLAVLMDVLQRPSQVVNRITKRFTASLQQDILVWANFLLPRPYLDV